MSRLPRCSGMRPGSSPSDSSHPPSPPSRRPWTFPAGPCVLRKQLASWRALPGVGRPPRFDGPMPTLDTLANRFARCVSLFRDASAKSDQKKEFRALLGLLQETPVTLRLAHGGSGIELNGVPCEGEGLAVLVQRLDLHGIGEIALPANPPPAQLFELLQALADQPGAHDVASRLAAAGADHIRLAPAGPPASPSPTAPPGPVASSEDFGAREPVVPSPALPRLPSTIPLPQRASRCRRVPPRYSPSSSAIVPHRTWATCWRR